MRPARGVTFFKKIETADMIGSIVVPQQTIEKLTAMQGEVVAVGLPEWCDDPDCKRSHVAEDVPRSVETMDPAKGHGVMRWLMKNTHRIAPHLKPGSWVLLAPRSWVETPDPQLYATTTDSILGVYRSPPDGG